MFALAAIVASCSSSLPDYTLDVWLDRTRQMESAGRRHVIGDGGRSRGPYQIGQRAWRQFGGREPWHVHAHDEAESRRVARRYIKAAIAQCRRRGWPVTFRNVRHLYRFGLYTSARP